MDTDHIYLDELAVPLARFFKLARLLMAEDPLMAELTSVDVPEVREMMARGNGVAKLIWPGRKRNHISYIVMDNGTPFTTSVLPKGHAKKDIIEVQISKVEPKLFPALREAGQTLAQQSRSTYDNFGCDDVLKSVGAYYEGDSEIDALRNELLLYAVMSDSPPGPENNNASEWAHESANRLLYRYANFTIAGEAIAGVFATLVYFTLSPLANRLYELGTAFTDEMVDLATPSRSQRPTPFPLLDLSFYLLHPEIIGPLTFVPARRGARFLQRLGDNLQREARAQPGLNRFHNSLYHALIHYRAAKVMYETILSKRVRTLLGTDWYKELVEDAEELKHDLRACEERRVAILASLTHVVGARHPSVPNFSDGLHFLTWIEWLRRLDFAKAELHTRDLELRLIYPKFLRDLSLGSIQVTQSSLFEKGIANLKSVAEFLEKNLASNMVLEEVNYLSPTYQLLADAFTQSGNVSEAQLYSAKATPEYMQQRVDTVLANNKG